eukprot:gene4860-9685_t
MTLSNEDSTSNDVEVAIQCMALILNKLSLGPHLDALVVLILTTITHQWGISSPVSFRYTSLLCWCCKALVMRSDLTKIKISTAATNASQESQQQQLQQQQLQQLLSESTWYDILSGVFLIGISSLSIDSNIPQILSLLLLLSNTRVLQQVVVVPVLVLGQGISSNLSAVAADNSSSSNINNNNHDHNISLQIPCISWSISLANKAHILSDSPLSSPSSLSSPPSLSLSSSLSKAGRCRCSFLWKQRLWTTIGLPMLHTIRNGTSTLQQATSITNASANISSSSNNNEHVNNVNVNVDVDSKRTILIQSLCGLSSNIPYVVLSNYTEEMLSVAIEALRQSLEHLDSSSIQNSKNNENQSFPLSLSSQALLLLELLFQSSIDCVGSQLPKAKDRAVSLRCLCILSTLPYFKIHPYKKSVLKTLAIASDDKKRSVRLLASRARNIWLTLS